jgi:hypothetical protein
MFSPICGIQTNTNTSNIVENRSLQGEVTYERGRLKEGS